MFFTSILGSYLLAVVAGEIHNSIRAYLLLLPAAFVFALSLVLMMEGLVVLLAAYRLTYVLGLGRVVFYATVLLTLFHYADSAQDVLALMYPANAQEIPSDMTFGMVAIAIPGYALLMSMYVRWQFAKQGYTNIHASGFQSFTIACICSSVIIGLLQSPILDAPTNLILPVWQVLVYPAAFTVLVAWSVVYIPVLHSPSSRTRVAKPGQIDTPQQGSIPVRLQQ